MRNYLIPAAALAMIGLATSASAADIAYVQEPVARVYAQAGPLPLQAAVDIANGMGLISVSNTNKWGNEWQIEGYDVAGSYMEVDVDARTGAVLDVDRETPQTNGRRETPCGRIDIDSRDFRGWCAREDSNLHDLHHCHLKAARLPIPPRALFEDRRLAPTVSTALL